MLLVHLSIDHSVTCVEASVQIALFRRSKKKEVWKLRLSKKEDEHVDNGAIPS